MRLRFRIAATLAVFLALSAPAVAAQQAAADSGRAAAERASTAGYAVSGFLGGLLLGFGGAALAENERPHNGARLHAGIGAAIVTGTVVSARGSRNDLSRGDAFQAEYTARVRERRTRASLLGGLAGTAMGASALAALLHMLGE
jgi:hypothetical protein